MELFYISISPHTWKAKLFLNSWSFVSLKTVLINADKFVVPRKKCVYRTHWKGFYFKWNTFVLYQYFYTNISNRSSFIFLLEKEKPFESLSRKNIPRKRREQVPSPLAWVRSLRTRKRNLRNIRAVQKSCNQIPFLACRLAVRIPLVAFLTTVHRESAHAWTQTARWGGDFRNEAQCKEGKVLFHTTQGNARVFQVRNDALHKNKKYFFTTRHTRICAGLSGRAEVTLVVFLRSLGWISRKEKWGNIKKGIIDFFFF